MWATGRGALDANRLRPSVLGCRPRTPTRLTTTYWRSSSPDRSDLRLSDAGVARCGSRAPAIAGLRPAASPDYRGAPGESRARGRRLGSSRGYRGLLPAHRHQLRPAAGRSSPHGSPRLPTSTAPCRNSCSSPVWWRQRSAWNPPQSLLADERRHLHQAWPDHRGPVPSPGHRGADVPARRGPARLNP
jgi:hypothetical protein